MPGQPQQPGFPGQPGFAAAPMAGQQQFQSLEGTFGQLTITGFNPASLNPDTLPRPTTAEASTDVTKVQPASRLEAVNANTHFVRMSTNFLPNSASVRNMWKLPIGEWPPLSRWACGPVEGVCLAKGAQDEPILSVCIP